MAKGIHNGLKTHTQDHVMTLHSFNTVKTIASITPKPKPLPDALSLILYSLIFAMTCFLKLSN